MSKVTIMGASGTIGKNVAFNLAKEDSVSEIVMFGRESSYDKITGEISDMYDALAAEDIDCYLKASCSFEDLEDSKVVLISSGIPRKEGMNRLDLAIPNGKIVKEYSEAVAKYAPDAIILIVTNPVDVMTTIALRASGFDKSKVIGLGNHLDSLRLKQILAQFFRINSGEINTRVIGEHGDHMVPLLSYTTIGGVLIQNFADKLPLSVEEMVERLRSAGNFIISRKGATEYGPVFAVTNIISVILNNSRKILTVSTYLEGEVEGVYDVSLGIPVILSRKGIRSIVPLKMEEDEKKQFLEAARAVKKSTYKVRRELGL